VGSSGHNAVVQRVALVPGFTQTASSWRGVIDVLGASCEPVALDVPERPTFAATALAIGELGARAVYVGYSMGGRLCVRLALDRPDLVDALVLVSASPGLLDEGERVLRVDADEELARAVERDGVDDFLTRWLAQPMFRSVPSDAPGLTDRRRLTPAFLAHCLRVLGTGAMEPLWDRLGELRMPVALVTGADDEKFGAIASRMLERLPGDAEHVQLEGGHAVPLEQPAALGRFIEGFVARRVHS
jgi:2-succinyl-6-hydroxy-2,4-cyclohexadiene-1-carboxylate synthase